jgi:hypothetical protein
MISALVRFATFISVAELLLAASAQAAPILVTFDSDPTFAGVANGFTSADSSQIHFSDSIGANLFIANSASQTNGSNALAVLFDDASALLIDLDFTANEISMNFGNDPALYTAAGDQAVLTLYRQGAFVDQVAVAMNRNTQMDQTIAFSGKDFDSARLVYSLQSGKGLTEAVDNVYVNAIPEPSAALVFGLGALLVGAASRRRRGSEAGNQR